MAGTFNPTIAIFNARLASLGFTTGYSLKWWHTRLDMMLEKQTGNININKLHLILLFEGDFNNNNKWLGHVVMFHVEQLQLIAKEQYGSQKEKSATIQCLNKWLLYDYVQIRHIPLVICSNDAKSCYNQIVIMVAALCLCQLGTPKVAVQSMVTTIHGMQHHIQSSYRDSMKSQGQHQWGNSIAGIGQGKPGHKYWAAVSLPLFQILTEEGFLTLVLTIHLPTNSGQCGPLHHLSHQPDQGHC